MNSVDETDSDSVRRIYLVDDHPLVREWLTNLIQQQPDLAVCGEADDSPKALHEIERLKPDVAIVDISLQSGSGLELVRDIKRLVPGVLTIVLSMHDELIYAERALRAGARGYVTKRETTRKIVSAIRTVLQGRLHLNEEFREAMTEKLLEGRANTSTEELLSDRELEVFRMMGQGAETRHIADRLCISMKTVQVYCTRIKEKLNVQTATELRREAVRWCESTGIR